MSERIFSLLADGLDSKLRHGIRRRAEAMMREVRYMSDNEEPHFLSIASAGWSLDRLAVLCVLSAFYQHVLGPLAAPSRPRCRSGLGGGIGIEYGAMARFDRATATMYRNAERAFFEILATIEVRRSWLFANHASDMVFQIFQSLE